jgi:hypothetical protein
MQFNYYSRNGNWTMNFMQEAKYNVYGVNYIQEDLNLKKFLAVTAGEATNNFTEAMGIGDVLLNRMSAVNFNSALDLISQIGGDNQYDAIGGDTYNAIMSMSLSDIFSPANPYSIRVSGAWAAIVDPTDITNGAYFWNATSQRSNSNPGYNWNNYNNGFFRITAVIGGTTFFGFCDPNTQWRP